MNATITEAVQSLTVDRSPEFDQTHWVAKTEVRLRNDGSLEFEHHAPQQVTPYSPPWPHLTKTAHGYELRRIEGGELLASCPDLKAAFAAKRLLSR
jgi:hypothetical protein